MKDELAEFDFLVITRHIITLAHRFGCSCIIEPTRNGLTVIIQPLNGAPYAIRVTSGDDEYFARVARVDGQATGIAWTVEATIRSIFDMVVSAELRAIMPVEE